MTVSKTQKVYEQNNPGIFVRVDRETYTIIAAIAKERRWSMANLLAWCMEQQLDLEPGSINRR